MAEKDRVVPVRICLIGVTHPCHNPRLLREADSLAEAGNEVRVVTPSFMLSLGEKDEEIVARRKWRHDKVDFRETGTAKKLRSFLIRGRRRALFELNKMVGGAWLAESGYTTALFELTREALKEPADWFIAHAHGALPVAARAASRWKAKLGFDCEDLLAENGTDPAEVIYQIERRYIPLCDYVSTPSEKIAEILRERYSPRKLMTLYNVFPLSLSSGMTEPSFRSGSSKLRLHWFSQTIGPGRGIEDAIAAAGILGDRVELSLRGNPIDWYKDEICSRAKQANVSINLLPQIGHDDLIRSMDEYDVGLALEQPANGNGSKTVSNKIGSYLLAGLAVAATNTLGQREILEKIPAAGFLYEAGEVKSLACKLKVWLEDREALRAARQTAWDAARARFCWDVEKEKFLQIFREDEG